MMELPSPKVIMIIAGIVFIVLTITEDEAPDGKLKHPEEMLARRHVMPFWP